MHITRLLEPVILIPEQSYCVTVYWLCTWSNTIQYLVMLTCIKYTYRHNTKHPPRCIKNYTSICCLWSRFIRLSFSWKAFSMSAFSASFSEFSLVPAKRQQYKITKAQ